MDHLDANHFFHPAQHGFRKGLSCETQLALFIHDLHMNLDWNKQTDAIFLDYQKAFDKVSHRHLLHKLSSLNLNSDVLKWLEAFLICRSQFVSVNDQSSILLPVSSGVPQGSVLGPLPFLIYINDLPLHVTCKIRMFADDCVIYHSISNITDADTLQQNLDHVQSWCSRWLMTLNPKKCKHMSFTRSRNPIRSSYTIANSPIDTVTSYKYLGVLISFNLNWGTHINNILSSANRSLGFLRRNLRHAPQDIRLLAYTSLIRPKVEYASPIWDPHQKYLVNALKSFQNRAARYIHSSYSYDVSISALKEKSKLQSLVHRRTIASLGLFHKFFYSSLNRMPYITPPARISQRTGHQLQVLKPPSHTTTFSASFFFSHSV